MATVALVQYTTLSLATGSKSETSGAVIFAARCQSCHSISAGVKGSFGPNLSNIGRDAASRRDELNASEYLLESIIKPEAYRHPGIDGHMPVGTAAGLSASEVRELITYLGSLGASVDTSAANALSIDTNLLTPKRAVDADLVLLQKGETLFFYTLNCGACHSIQDQPGGNLIGPSLADAGRFSPEYVSSSIREPSSEFAVGWRDATIKMSTSETINGRLLLEEDTSISLLTRDSSNYPVIRKIDRKNISDINYSDVSRMPAYKLTAEDEAAIVAFLGFQETAGSDVVQHQ